MKISIITAAYNSAETLADTIESVVRQTYKDIEYIVVDGCSTDHTAGIVERYKPLLGERLVYICEPDKGIYDAMNKGLKAATGDVIGLLNSDDFFTSNDVVERMAEWFSRHDDTEAVYGDVHYVKPENVERCVRYYSSQMFSRGWMRLGFMPAHPSFYCKKAVYERLGYYNLSYKVAADFELLLRFIFIHHIRTHYIPNDFVTMRMGGVSSSGISSHRQIMRDHRQALRANKVWSCYPLLMLRYVYKVCEVAWSRIKKAK